MTLVLAVLILALVVNCCYMIYLIADVTAHSDRAEGEPGKIAGLGVFSFFQFLLSTFGISDFAIGTAAYSKLKWVSAKKLPGTLNNAAVIPVAVMALVYITSIEVEPATLVVPIIAQMAGAYITPRFVVKMPVKPIRILLAFGIFVTVLRLAAEGSGFFPPGGDMTGLEWHMLLLFSGLCFVYGALNNLGIGSFAPTLATVYVFGLNPVVAFPIMMGAATFSLPIGSIQFIKHDSYSRKITIISAVCGTLGVLAAAFAVKDTDISLLKWLITAVLLYSACSMILAALKDKEDHIAAPEAEKTDHRLPFVGRLTNFCLALFLVCTVSLIVLCFTNVHRFSSDYVRTNLGERNTRLRDSVHAYLREHENLLLSARGGVAHFMSEEPVDLERLRTYLENSARVLDDISTLYCTTNEVWNREGGYAVFSQPWDVPPDWDNTQRPWFLAAKKTPGKIAYSRPYLDALTGDIILDMSITVHGANGKDIGVVSEAIAIESLNAMLRKSVSLQGQQVFLIDSEGTFVVHPDKKMAAQGNFFKEHGLEEYRGKILSEDLFSISVADMAVYSSSIPASGWVVVSLIPTGDIFTSTNERLSGMFLTPVLIIVFMLLIVLISLLIAIRRESKDKLAAEWLTREKDSFIARMSHELRTPMNAVIGMSELAERDYGSSKTLEYIQGIKSAGTALRAIINDILDFSKIESGRLELAAVPYATASMLNDALTIIRAQMVQKPLELRVKADPALPGMVTGDATRVIQVLLNLLNNAVKYTPEGFISFSVSGERVTESMVRLTFVVEDSGIGIRAEDMPKLFGDFTRIDEKRNSAIEGTGLGLSIARSLCRAMGGDVSAASEYGKGSIFTATLVQAVAGWQAMGDLAAMPATGAGSQRISFIAPDADVLVVDDFPNNLTVAEGLLRPYKMCTRTCLNGREAVEQVQACSFDLVLMDHMMPEMDGMEAAQAIRALGGRHAKLPIVVVTAHAAAGMKEMFLANGFDDYIAKPLATAELDEVLQRWIPAGKQQSVPATEEAPGAGRTKAVFASSASLSSMAGANKAEQTAQQLNLLNHFRWHFANGELPVDQDYCEKFSALVEAMDVPERLCEDMASLAAAGRRGDREEIARLLPDVCGAIAAMQEERETGESNDFLKDLLERLQAALDTDDGAGVKAAMNALQAMDTLNADERELYFFLNDAFLMGETEKASTRLAGWMRERLS